MHLLTPETKIRLSQIKEFNKKMISDKHNKTLSKIPEGAVRRWKDNKLHRKTEHGWVTVPESEKYNVQFNKGSEKKNKDNRILGKQVTQEEFDEFIDKLYENSHLHKPQTIELPKLRRGLMKQIGLDTNDTFLFNTRFFHISPERKKTENQLFRKEEYKQIPQIIKNARHAILEKDTGKFKIIFEDKKDPKKYNKIIFSKISKGNYIVSLGKVDKENVYNRKKDKIVGEGVAPSI